MEINEVSSDGHRTHSAAPSTCWSDAGLTPLRIFGFSRRRGIVPAILLDHAAKLAAWAAVVLRGLERTAAAARKGRKWERAYLVGLGVGCAFEVGVVLSMKNSLPLDTFGLGFLLAAGAGFAIWAFGRRGQPGKRKAVRSKRQTEQPGEDGLGFHSME